MRFFIILFVAAFTPEVLIAQIPPSPSVLPVAPATDFNSYRPTDGPTSAGTDYKIGRDDLIDVSVFEVPSLNTVSRVTATGTLAVPFIGAVEAAGKTTPELGRTIEDALRGKYVNDPHVTVFVREYASQPVSVVGAVKMPGIYQLKGQKRLLDVIAMAQGLSENAGSKIQVIHSKNARSSAETGDTADAARETVSIGLTGLFQNGNPELNIPIESGDVINVLYAGSIFTVGELQRPGEYTLKYGRDVTVIQAIGLGGGLTKDAKRAQSYIIRPHADGTKEQIPINIAKILDGSQPDVSLQPNDVLFVPPNKVKAGLSRTLDSVLAVAIGRVIYAGF